MLPRTFRGVSGGVAAVDVVDVVVMEVVPVVVVTLFGTNIAVVKYRGLLTVGVAAAVTVVEVVALFVVVTAAFDVNVEFVGAFVLEELERAA